MDRKVVEPVVYEVAIKKPVKIKKKTLKPKNVHDKRDSNDYWDNIYPDVDAIMSSRTSNADVSDFNVFEFVAPEDKVDSSWSFSKQCKV